MNPLSLLKKAPPAPDVLLVERDRVLEKMKGLEPTDPEYMKMLVVVGRLNAMIPELPEKQRIKPDTIANLLAYLGHGFMTLHFEKLNVITSKAFGAKPLLPPK